MILRFSEVTKRFGSKTLAVNGVSCAVPRGQFCAIIGASGAGKSTLLRTVNGLITPTSGKIEFDGVEVTSRTLWSVRRHIGMVHQQFNLVPRLSVLKNVLAGALPAVSTWRALLGLFPISHQRLACELLSEVGLDESQLYRRAMHLSGGQQQRVAIARAFVMEPDLVLADEPVASLDPQNSRMILKLLRAASIHHGATVLCSLHQVDLAKEFSDRIVGMRDGRIVFDGKPDEFDVEAQKKVYEGIADDGAGSTVAGGDDEQAADGGPNDADVDASA